MVAAVLGAATPALASRQVVSRKAISGVSGEATETAQSRRLPQHSGLMIHCVRLQFSPHKGGTYAALTGRSWPGTIAPFSRLIMRILCERFCES